MIIATGALRQLGVYFIIGDSLKLIVPIYLKIAFVIFVVNSILFRSTLQKIKNSNTIPQSIKVASRELGRKIHLFSTPFLIDIIDVECGDTGDAHNILNRLRNLFFSHYLPDELLTYIEIDPPSQILSENQKIYFFAFVIIGIVFMLAAFLIKTVFLA